MSAKIGKVGKKGGEMREKEKQKKRHEGATLMSLFILEVVIKKPLPLSLPLRYDRE